MHWKPIALLTTLGLLVAAGRLSVSLSAAGGSAPAAARGSPDTAPAQRQFELERLRKEGIQAAQQGDLSRAEAAFQAGLDKAKALHDLNYTARFLNNLGIIEKNQGQWEKALDHLIQSRDLDEQRGDRHDKARSLTNLGTVYFRLGQYEEAVRMGSEALHLQWSEQNEHDAAASLTNLGNAYRCLGQLDRARACLDQAWSIRERSGTASEQAETLTGQGLVSMSRGQYPEAVKTFTRVRQRDETLANPLDSASTLTNLGNAYLHMDQVEDALDCYTQARKLLAPLGSPPAMAGILTNLGSLYFRLGKADQARQLLTQALEQHQRLGNQPDMARTWGDLGLLDEQQDRLDQAEADFAHAVQSFEAVSAQLVDPSQLGAFQEVNQQALYARYAALLLRRRRPAAALAMLERGRAQGLARQLILNRVDLSALLSRADAVRLAARTQELTIAGKLLYDAQTRPEPPKETAEHRDWEQQQASTRQRCDTAGHELALLQDSLFASYPVYRQVQGQRPPTPAQLSALAERRPDTLFLEWAIVDDRTTLLFALSQKQGLKSFTLPMGRATLEPLVHHWQLQVITGALEEPEAAEAVYRAVLGPVEKAELLKPGRYARLVLVGDGPLLSIPWAALRDGSRRRLLERYPLATSISLGVLTWPPNARRPTAPLLAAADPLADQEKPLQTAQRGGGAGETRARRSGLAPLKHARAEARQVTGLFPGAVGLIGQQAREGEVKRQMGKYALLHFATHGVLDEQDGLRSWLLLAPEPPDSAEDGRLEGREIVGLPLSARLAVLSACQTGLGQRSGGEGLLGLAWAFRAAGCPSVVASLWSVDDQATGRLMADFYRRLKAGARKDAALREAMQDVRKDPLYRHPYFWAAFQVIGETAALTLPPTSKPSPARN